MFGWTGKILSIDLNSGKHQIIRPEQDIYYKYIGGKGLAGYFLKDYITEAWDSTGMPLLFFTGPLVNTAAPTSGRMTVMSRSPLTGTVGDASVGGGFGSQLKKAGYDGLILTGKCIRLSGIEITGTDVRIVDSQKLKGHTNSEMSVKLSGKGALASVGPAAENGVLFASIAVDNHFFAGRNGLGLVMAGKNLKYITVTGTETTQVFDKKELNGAKEEIFRLTSASPVLMGESGIANMGTGALYDLIHARYMMPTDNFRKTRFDQAGKMNAFSYMQKYHPRRSGCRGCHILCKKTGEGKEVLPEFETMSHFSALIGNTSIETVVEANKICNELGMDSISAGSSLACYKEITGQILTPERILQLLTEIGYGHNEGKMLGSGSFRYAEMNGKPGLSISVKKLELPAYDPRGAYGMALAYVTSTRGGCHLRAYPIAHEILRKPVVTDRFTFSGKARIIKIAEDMNAMVDSLVACKFIFLAASLEEYARALYGVTGFKTTAQDLLHTGERIYYNDRIMNAMNGFTSADDDLPERFFNEHGDSGEGINIPAIDRKSFLEARDNYYRIRGLDENGMPLPEKIKMLGLE